jgi:hypothetical protein
MEYRLSPAPPILDSFVLVLVDGFLVDGFISSGSKMVA